MEKERTGPVKVALVGGILLAFIAVVAGQNISPKIEASQDMTLLLVGGGFVVGAVGGYLIGRFRR